ncbi:ABC transporter ATP-binding protein [Paenibacillus herberti]|uniref:ABC transporter n=1 Tax=Paenibacillus herberti TaxID=1619309 RepID=A0A229P2B8_9BACL|nr:ABC transporter ATP-binding protein [Paenibacillus herberti]OXM16436.1 ABC transporter [Paenibacillus herberti]
MAGQEPENRAKQDREKAGQSAAIRGLLVYAKPHKRQFVGVVGCTIIAIAADLLQPYIVKIAIDDHLMNGSKEFSPLLLLGGLYLLLSLLSLLFSYIQNQLIQIAGQGIVMQLRKDLFRHLSRLSPSFYDRMSSGGLVTHISGDTETVSQFFTQVCLSLVRDGMTLAFILFFMFQLDPVLAGYSLLLLPAIALIAALFRGYMRKTYQLSRSRLSRLIAFTAENLSGMNLVQAFHQEREQVKQFEDRNSSYYEANLREIRTNVLFNRSFDLLGNLSVAFVTWIGGRAVYGEGLEFGVLYAFITYIRQFFQPINSITQQWNTLQAASVSADRIWRLFKTNSELADKGVTTIGQDGDPRRAVGAVRFNDVVFGYTPEEPVLQGISLDIEPGQRIGIVGTTGAGKSSLISLLCRFYDTQRGSVTIDGVDVRQIPLVQLRRAVGLVQQEPYLFSGSIIDNVRLFDSSISPEQVREACRFVGADALVGRLPDGYETLLSEKGSGLSAGERQLISFARIVVFRPSILILDEATANLDSSTEQMVQQALNSVSVGRTTFVIAHRISTVMDADRIIVLRSGRIAESGSHSELMRRGGYYARLYAHSQGEQEEQPAG